MLHTTLEKNIAKYHQIQETKKGFQTIVGRKKKLGKKEQVVKNALPHFFNILFRHSLNIMKQEKTTHIILFKAGLALKTTTYKVPTVKMSRRKKTFKEFLDKNKILEFHGV